MVGQKRPTNNWLILFLVRANSPRFWDPFDLVRRVISALENGLAMIVDLDEMESNNAEALTQADGVNDLLWNKVFAETAMLLLCVEPIQGLDQRIQELASALARRLIPHARNQDVRAAICLDPGLAQQHAISHSILSRLGYLDPETDALYARSLEMGVAFGPERLPHRQLEQTWLTRMWKLDTPPPPDDSLLLARSALGRPLDVLGSTRFDLYAFTHAVMYTSDLGGRKVVLNRPLAEIAADASAGLGYSLDSNDFDLTAELLLTWPMLQLEWSPVAVFAFTVLAHEEDKWGFLPGRAFDSAHYHAAVGEDRSRYARTTSYHTSYVMGFLCAAVLREGCAPPSIVPSTCRASGAGVALLALASKESIPACWRAPFQALNPGQQDAVASLILTVILRRARAHGNIRLIRDALELAVAHSLADGPAPRQAAALLQRCQLLNL